MATESRVRDLMQIRHIVSPDQVTGVERLNINSERDSQSPTLGVLTRTLVYTPIIKWAFAARIRHADQSDVVLVRENAVEIRRYIVDDFRLEDVAFKADFGSSIRAAQIIGAPKPLSDAKSRDETANSREPSAEEILVNFKVPPQMLALVLQTEAEQSLLVLFAFHDTANEVQFASFRHSLYPSNEASGQLGERIAVDPESRVIAISAQEGRMAIYQLKPRDDIVSEVQVDGRIIEEQFHPILSDKLLKVDGFILLMDFLQPPASDPSLITLLLVVSTRGQLKQYVYRWDSASDLHEVNVDMKVYGLKQELASPLLLIPLKIPLAFALVCEHKLGVCGDASEYPHFEQVYDLFNVGEQGDEAADDPGNSLGVPLYTGWARPLRHVAFNKDGNDTVYLCREDGLVRFVEFQNKGSIMKDANTPLGHLRVNVNAAFTVLDHDVDVFPRGSAADVLLVGGHMSNGGLFTLKAHQDAILQQSIPNWTPTLDFAAASGSASYADSSVQTRTFACTGRGRRHGSICEIRHGISAYELVSIDMGEFLYGKPWLLPDDSNDTIHVLTSTPDGTSVTPFAKGSISTNFDAKPEHWTSFVERDHSTICATRTLQGIYIQLTDSSLRAIHGSIQDADSCKPLLENFEENSITCASIDGNSSSILLTARIAEEYRLLYGRVVRQRGCLTLQRFEAVSLEDEPSCVHVQYTEGSTVLLLGTRAGELLLYEPFESTLKYVGCYRFETEEEDICESVVALPKDPQRLSGTTVVCGLRSGSLQVLEFTRENRAFGLLAAFKLGNTAVDVKHSYSPYSAAKNLPDGAIIICDESIYHLTSPVGHSIGPDSLRRIWFTDTQGIGICQPALKAAGQLEPWNQRLLEEAYSELCFGLLERELKIFHLNSIGHSRVIPRHIYVGGNPYRVLYLKQFKKLVAALTINKVIDATTQVDQPRDPARLSFSALRFLDPDDPEAGDVQAKEEAFEVPQNLPPDRRFFAATMDSSGERITDMAEWSVAVAEKRWQFLLVSTSKPSRAGSSPKGRIYMYNISIGGNGELALDLKLDFNGNGPVYCVAEYDKSSFVYCSGQSLFRQSFEFSDQVKRLDNNISTELGSNGRNVSVRGSLIYVSTSAHSLRVFKAGPRGFANFFNDSISRNSLNHLVLSGTSLILAADSGANIAGFWQPPESAESDELQTVFEAKLASKVSCLRKATLRAGNDLRSTSHFPPVLASTIDGTFYRIEILEDKAMELLCFLQKLAQRSKTLCPYTQDRVPVLTQAGMLTAPRNPRERHVDGDLLAHILRGHQVSDHVAMLQDLLRMGEEDVDPQVSEIFERLAAVAVEDAGVSTEDLLRSVVEYLRMLL